VSSWYLNKNLKPHGPFSFAEMKNKILRGEVAPTEFILNESDGEWRAAKEWREFSQEIFPAFQVNYFKKSSPQEKEWILLDFKGEIPRQQGPFSVGELQHMQKSGLVHSEDYVWRSGLTGWVRICDRQEFS
jgi:hypothetical protein